MKKSEDGIDARKTLRTEAETLVSSLAPAEDSAKPAEVLLHELLVHKIELEMQNEELRRAHLAIEEARDRYVDLYEFAPVGYITISREGLMSEINLTGAALLGVERSQLVNRRFSKFISLQDTDRWHRLFMSMMEHPKQGKQSLDLEMVRTDGPTFHAHLDCLRRDVMDAPPILRLALTDISKLKKVEEELRIYQWSEPPSKL